MSFASLLASGIRADDAKSERVRGGSVISSLIPVVTVLLAAFVVIVAGLLVALLASRAISALRLSSRAKHDHRVARGTQHLKQLKDPLLNLRRDVKSTEGEVKTIKRRLSRLASSRHAELEEALSRHLVTQRLTEVEGIGPRLQRRIVRYCFRGKLRDLRHVERVSGVGPTRQRAIMRWVAAREREFPRLMESSFPGKRDVTAKYKSKIAPLQARLGEARKELKEKRDLLASVTEAVDKLRSVQATHFRKALGTRTEEEPVPNWYLEGVYPGWECPPEWFTTLMDGYGG